MVYVKLWMWYLQPILNSSKITSNPFHLYPIWNHLYSTNTNSYFHLSNFGCLYLIWKRIYVWINALHYKNKIFPMGVGSVSKTRMLRPKGLSLSPTASNPFWWAVYKSNISPLWDLRLALALVWIGNLPSPILFSSKKKF